MPQHCTKENQGALDAATNFARRAIEDKQAFQVRALNAEKRAWELVLLGGTISGVFAGAAVYLASTHIFGWW